MLRVTSETYSDCDIFPSTTLFRSAFSRNRHVLQRQQRGVALPGHGDGPAGDGGLRGGRVVEARGQFARQAQLDVARVQAGSDVGPKLLRLLHADVEAQQLDPLPHQVVADLHRLVDDVDRKSVV